MDKNPQHEVLGTSVVSAALGVWTCVHTHCVGGCELTLRFSVVSTLPSSLGASGKCVLGPGAAHCKPCLRSTPESVKTHLTDGNIDVIGMWLPRRQCLVDVV